MHTGYDNYWMYNRQDSLLNLPKSNFSHSVPLDSYKHAQDGRHTAMPNRFLSPRNNITAKNQNIVTNQQRMPQYAWTSPVCAQPTRPNNYQKGFGMQQKDPRLYWDRSGYININNNVPQPLNNNMSQKIQAVENNNNTTTQIPRIRVRDVNSLNNIARNSMLNSAMQQRQFDRYTNCSYNVGEEQQSLPQKGNTEHANYIPSLLEVNPFQPPVQRPTTAPIQPLCQEQLAADPRRTSFSSGNQFQVNNTRRNEAYGNSASLLEELLTFTTNQLDNLQAAEAAQNAQTVNNNMSVPHNVAKDNDLSLLKLLEDSCPYRNPPTYAETFAKTANPPLTVERSSLPIIEPISPPPVENDTAVSGQPLRITAVISLPDLTNINFNKPISTEKSLPNSAPQSSIEPRHTDHDIPAKTVPVNAVNDSLKVKDEPLVNSEFSNDMEIVIETIKTENIQEQDENVQKTENKEKKTCSGKRNENSNIDAVDQIQTEKFTAKETTNTQNNVTATNDMNLTSCYKSEINRDKLDMLIKFLHYDENGSEYVNEQIYPEKSNSKKHKKVDTINKQKLNRSFSGKSTNGKTESVPNKSGEIEGMRCSPLPSQIVESEECMKKTQNKSKEQNLKVGKKLEETSEKAKLKNDALKQNSDCKNDQMKKFKSKKDNPKKKVKTVNKSVCTESQTEKTAKKEGSDVVEKCKTPDRSKGKTPADVTQSTEVENSQDKVFSLPSLEENQNEKPKDTQTDKIEKTELKMTSPKLPKSPENVTPFQEASQEKDADGTVRKSSGRIFPNFNYHFCGSCNLVSPIEWFWINAVTGELKCLNCFKRMNLDSIETNYKLPFSEERDPDGNKDFPNSPKMKNTTTGDLDKQTNQKVGDKVNKTSNESQGDKNENRHCLSKEELSKEKRKSLDEDLFQDKKEKKRKSDEKSDKKVEQTEETNETNVRSKTVTESSKLDKANRKSLSKDGSESPKREERPRKNSTDQIKKSQSREEESTLKVRKAEGEASKKRRNSKEECGPKKFRLVEESGEDLAEKFVTEKLKKMKESVQKIKMMEMEEMERRRKSASKEKETTDKEIRYAGEKPLKPKENDCHKILRELFEDDPTTKPLKEKQNTKIQSQGYEKLMEKRKKLENNMNVKLLKESVERRKRKNGGIKGPLQYKDFVLNKSAESYFPEVMEGFSLKKIMKDADATKKNLKKYKGKNDERYANLFAKLKKKTKTLSLNLLKET